MHKRWVNTELLAKEFVGGQGISRSTAHDWIARLGFRWAACTSTATTGLTSSTPGRASRGAFHLATDDEHVSVGTWRATAVIAAIVVEGQAERKRVAWCLHYCLACRSVPKSTSSVHSVSFIYLELHYAHPSPHVQHLIFLQYFRSVRGTLNCVRQAFTCVPYPKHYNYANGN